MRNQKVQTQFKSFSERKLYHSKVQVESLKVGDGPGPKKRKSMMLNRL